MFLVKSVVVCVVGVLVLAEVHNPCSKIVRQHEGRK